MKYYTNEVDIWPDAAAALEDSLRQLPGARVTVAVSPELPGGKRPDLIAHLTRENQETVIIGEVKRTGEPRYAQEAFRLLKDHLKDYGLTDPGAVGVFIAPYISPETANLCRAENISYLDLSGNCHLAFADVYIHIEGKPNPAAHSRPLRSLYQPKAERVLRVLLTPPLKSWRLQALADEADVSIGQSYKVKELLLEKEWVQETERGLCLLKPGELLAAWAERYRSSKHQAAQFFTLTELGVFERGLSDICRSLGASCAFTGLAAAARYAPYAAYQRTTAYVSADLKNLQEPLGLTPVQTGANVLLLTPYDAGVFYGARQQQGVSLASPIQTYLDLQSLGARGREAAEVLLQKEIVPNW